MRHTLFFDDDFFRSLGETESYFKFSDEVDKQHAIVLLYLSLCETTELLKECEYYFRRYPFRDLPVTRHSHLVNVCEMYFTRFYEFKERLKKYLNAMKAVGAIDSPTIGRIIKGYESIFDRELRARNSIHHHERFSDVAIDRVMVTHSITEEREEHLRHYRKASSEWAQRARIRSSDLETFLEAMAELAISRCAFLAQGERRKRSSRKR